ncbi:MAG: hypothetical protein AB7G06_01655 [Bdellovibrionales bacterium]
MIPDTPKILFCLTDATTKDGLHFEAMNTALAAKGFIFAGEGTTTTGKVLLVYFTYEIAPKENIFSRRYHLHAALLPLKRAQTLAADGSAFAALVSKAKQGDRDLRLRPGDEFIADLSSNRARSSVWVIRRNGQKLLRKAFNAGSIAFVEREVLARSIIKDTRMAPIVLREGNVLYMPFYQTGYVWREGLLNFYPRPKAAQIFDFLGAINRQGYSMIDINPSAFLWDETGALRVVDFEFFTQTRVADDLRKSVDFIGDVGHLPAPAKNGYKRYWYDPLGGPWPRIMEYNKGTRLVVKALHLLFYRLPRRAAKTLDRARKSALTYLAAARDLKAGGLKDGYFNI